MSELMGVDENFAQSDDEYVDFAVMTRSPQPPALKIVGRRSSLPPVSEFQDDDADATDLDFEEKIRGPIMVTMRSQDSHDYYHMDVDEEKQRLINLKKSLKRRHSDSTVLMRDPTQNHDDNMHPPDLSALHEIEHDLGSHDYPTYDRRDSNYSQMSHFSHLSTITDVKEEDGVDKLLRRVSGCSYNKYRNGNGVKDTLLPNGNPELVKMDSGTRDKLKIEIVKYIDLNRLEYEQRYKAEKESLVLKYQKEVKQWEDKYRKLKRENKKTKMKNNQRKQKNR